ncbi:MAG: 50S ribosomal protein L9 [Sinomicrobium sp.]|nr:50S ribosomal protein L9 [Sinomicrobium sp.]
MELILKQDVQHLGFKDDVVRVKDGYGRNYLIPRGFAVLATPSAKKVLEETLKQRAFKEEKIIKEARETAGAIRALEIKIVAKVSSGNKLFGSVTNANLEEAIQKANIAIDKKYISIRGGTIKSVGKYEATVRLHREVTAVIAFEVVAEPK